MLSDQCFSDWIFWVLALFSKFAITVFGYHFFHTCGLAFLRASVVVYFFGYWGVSQYIRGVFRIGFLLVRTQPKIESGEKLAREPPPAHMYSVLVVSVPLDFHMLTIDLIISISVQYRWCWSGVELTLRNEIQKWNESPPYFERLVLGCIEAATSAIKY